MSSPPPSRRLAVVSRGRLADDAAKPRSEDTALATAVSEAAPVPGNVREVLEAILAALQAMGRGEDGESIELAPLGEADLAALDRLLGEGEVWVFTGGDRQAHETVFAGVWRRRECDAQGTVLSDSVEIGSFPAGLLDDAFADALAKAPLPGPDVRLGKAAALVREINRALAGTRGMDRPVHVLDLTTQSHFEESRAFLGEALGEGELTIVVGGGSECRIQASLVRDTWWVRHFDGQGRLALEALEIAAIPEMALAAPEDLAESARRLEVLLKGPPIRAE